MISISFHLFPFHKGLSRSLSSTIIKYTYIHPAAKEGHSLFAIDYENQQIIYTFSLLYLKTGLYICTYTICILLHIPKLWLNFIQWFPNKLRETDSGKVLFCTKRRGTCKGAQYLCCGVYTYVYIQIVLEAQAFHLVHFLLRHMRRDPCFEKGRTASGQLMNAHLYTIHMYVHWERIEDIQKQYLFLPFELCFLSLYV